VLGVINWGWVGINLLKSTQTVALSTQLAKNSQILQVEHMFCLMLKGCILHIRW